MTKEYPMFLMQPVPIEPDILAKMIKGEKLPLPIKFSRFSKLDEPKEWYIWSNEHNAWWKENHSGYDQNVQFAGTYTTKEAFEILHGANIATRRDPSIAPFEAMVHVSCLSEGKPYAV